MAEQDDEHDSCLDKCAHFTYSRLVNKLAIRLLQILPGKTEDRLRCNFSDVVLDEEACVTSYTAISYTWGNASSTNCPLLLNGQYFATTQSAWNVISSLRKSNTVLTVWIDAICINQDDIAERNDQVRLMGKIFGRAHNTVVWLGLASEDSGMAMNFMRSLGKALEDLQDIAEVNEEMVLQRTSTRFNSPQWLSVARLFARPWFRRLWVVQEVALSNSIHIMCGNCILPWEDLAVTVDALHTRRLAHLVRNRIPPSNQNTAGVSSFWSMHQMRKLQMVLGEKQSLAAILMRTVGLLSSDNKDQIFGVLGLTSYGDVGMTTNYDSCVEDVYINAVQWSLEYENNVDWMYLAGINHHRAIQTLPSWVPDFSTGLNMNPFGMGLSRVHEPCNVAKSSYPPAIVNTRISNRSLICQGVIIDTVENVGSTRIASDQDRIEGAHKTWNGWACEAIQFAAIHHKEDCLWRTMIANNHDRSSKPAPPYYESYFQNFKDLYLDGHRFANMPWDEACSIVAHDLSISTELKGQAYQYLIAWLEASFGRRICYTAGANIGLVPSGAIPGDFVCIFADARVPFVLRESRGQNISQRTFILVGDCYIDGVSMEDIRSFKTKDIRLI